MKIFIHQRMVETKTVNNLNVFKRSIVRVDFKSFLQCY